MKCLLRRFGLAVFLFIFSPHGVFAAGYKAELQPGLSLWYRHWDTEKKEVTGYTRIRTRLYQLEGNNVILEESQNTKPNGKVFSERTIAFDIKTGWPLRYEERDFRSNLHVINRFLEKEIQTRVEQDSKNLIFSMPVKAGLISFEILVLALRNKLPALLQGEQFDFTLYLSALAIELEKKHFPRSLSQFRMQTCIEEKLTMDTVLGRQPVVRILLEPISKLIKSLLPKNRTEYRFTFLATPPYHLLVFEEGKTRLILDKIGAIE